MSDEDALSSLYVELKLIRGVTSLREEADKNLRLVQERYRCHHDHHVQLGPMFQKDDEAYLGRTFLFRSASRTSAAQRHINL